MKIEIVAYFSFASKMPSPSSKISTVWFSLLEIGRCDFVQIILPFELVETQTLEESSRQSVHKLDNHPRPDDELNNLAQITIQFLCTTRVK